MFAKKFLLMRNENVFRLMHTVELVKNVRVDKPSKKHYSMHSTFIFHRVVWPTNYHFSFLIYDLYDLTYGRNTVQSLSARIL